MNILQSIFTDYYKHIIYELHPRPAVIENVNKMIHCGDSSHGGAMYGCPHCGNLKFVPFRCKSRFCPSCGNKYNQLRSFHMSCKLVSCVHRHCEMFFRDVDNQFLDEVQSRNSFSNSFVVFVSGVHFIFNFTKRWTNGYEDSISQWR